jgi:hypothetical protein
MHTGWLCMRSLLHRMRQPHEPPAMESSFDPNGLISIGEHVDGCTITAELRHTRRSFGVLI